MTITNLVRIEITEEEMQLIRDALLDKTMKELLCAHEIQRKCLEDGLTDNTSYVHMEKSNKLHAMINTIDELTRA